LTHDWRPAPIRPFAANRGTCQACDMNLTHQQRGHTESESTPPSADSDRTSASTCTRAAARAAVTRTTYDSPPLSFTSPLLDSSPFVTPTNSASTSRSDSPAHVAKQGWESRLRSGASPPCPPDAISCLPDAPSHLVTGAQTSTPPPIRRPLFRSSQKWSALSAPAQPSADMPQNMAAPPMTPPTFSERAVPWAPHIDTGRSAACARRAASPIDMDMFAEAFIPAIPRPPSVGLG